MNSNLNYRTHLGDWVFHFNTYTKKWEAVERAYYNELFNGDKGHVVKSSDINTLIQVINRKLYKTLK